MQETLKESNDVDQTHMNFFNGYVSMIKNDEKLFYSACPNDNCRRKVLDDGNGGFRCENCNRTFEKCIPTYMI